MEIKINIFWMGLLSCTFAILKLAGVINWAWTWIFAPVWIPVAMICLLVLFVFLVAGLSFMALTSLNGMARLFKD